MIKESSKVVSLGTVSQRPGVMLSRLPAPVQRVRERASEFLRPKLQATLDIVDDALFKTADQAESNQAQGLWFEAMREVRLQREALEKGFLQTLDQGFADLLNPASSSSQTAETPTLEDLALVDNVQLELQVAQETMATRVLNACAEPCQHIALRLDSLVPAKVYQTNNPLGPEHLSSCLRKPLEGIEIDIRAKLLIMKHFEREVLSSCEDLYHEINVLLISEKVLPSLATEQQRREVRRQAERVESTPKAEDRVEAPRSDETAVRNHVTGNADIYAHLCQLLNQGQADGSALSGEASRQVASKIQGALNHLQGRLPEACRDDGRLITPEQLISWLQKVVPSAEKAPPGARETLRLVTMMFEFVLDDRNLAAPLKAVVARLQIPMVRVALEDPDFFNNSDHPARSLVNEMAAAGVGWAPESDPNTDPLLQKITEIVEAVLTQFDADVDIFDRLLADFRGFLEKDQKRVQMLETRTLAAEEGRARTDEAKSRIAFLIVEVVAGRQLPGIVQQFIRDVWSKVLLQQMLKNGDFGAEWELSILNLKTLVLALVNPLEGQERERLQNDYPSLMADLRRGCESIALDEFAISNYLEEFTQLINQKLSCDLQATPAEPLPSNSDEHTPNGESSNSEHNDLVAPQGKQDAVESAEVEGRAEVSAEAETDVEEESIDVAWLSHVDRLAPGCWFEVRSEGETNGRRRLAAVIRSVDRYIFVNRKGVKVSECSRAELAKLMATGEYMTLDDGALFDRALESVIGSLRNKSRHAADS